MAGKERQNESLPACVTEYINLVVRKIKYRRKVRQDVRQELTDHFTDSLAEYQTEEQRQQAAEKLIAEFGDPKLLARLIRRGKKRCRPLWKKIMDRFSQGLLVFFALFIIYNAWIIHTWRNSDFNFVERFNQLNPSADEQENAWNHYQKAMELYLEKPQEYQEEIDNISRYDDLSEDAKRVVRQWLAENEPAWQETMQGTQLKYCWRELNEEDTPANIIDRTMKPLEILRPLARMGGWRARCDVADKRGEDALEECMIIVKMGRHMLSQKLLVEKLVGISLNTIGCSFIKEVLSESEIGTEDLAKIQQELENNQLDETTIYNMQGEIIYSLALIKQSLPEKRFLYFFPLQILVPGTMKETESEIAGFYRNSNLGTPYQKRIFHKEKDTNSDFFPVFTTLLNRDSSFDRIIELVHRNKALNQATITILALRRRQMEKGAYPEKLEQLVTEEYLRQLPDDPYSDGILRYEKRGDDFILYSLGRNFIDDGGIINPDNEWGDEEQVGDRVFWPVSQ